MSSIFSGANLAALVTIETSSHAEQERLSVEASGSGWGVTVSGSVEESGGSERAQHERKVSVLLTGGRNESIPTTPEEVVETVGRLAVVAHEAPKDFTMGVTPYEIVSNWPGRNLTGVETEFEQLASRWGAYSALYDEIQQVLDRPADHHVGLGGEGAVSVGAGEEARLCADELTAR